ncbi:substrate-binding periplasmic protein [Spartinivicinus ruber]|uniref:substrate-binding periplasmic protein n=1 Tax=Spartinivicinus ruber TaxID=2683272 RepID=UPI0013D3C2FF|nr:transporter substrate-binding domain-containing protein [Spartinivicinus ruber]
MKLIQSFFITLAGLMMSNFSTVMAETDPPIVVTGDWAPFTGQDLPNGGMMVEIVESALKAAKQLYKLEYLPWKRGYQYTIDTKVMAGFPWMRTEDRIALFKFSLPFYQANERFFVHKSFDRVYEKDEDLKGLTVCLPMGWAVEPMKRFIDKKILTLYQPHTDDACFKGIKTKRVDLYSINEVTGWHSIKKAKLDPNEFKVLKPVVRENKYYIVVSKTHPQGDQFLASFNKGINAIKEDGTYQKILDKHMKIIQGEQK